MPQPAVPESDASTFTASVLAVGESLHLSGHSAGR
jgi:hypothetical protein